MDSHAVGRYNTEKSGILFKQFPPMETISKRIISNGMLTLIRSRYRILPLPQESLLLLFYSLTYFSFILIVCLTLGNY